MGKTTHQFSPSIRFDRLEKIAEHLEKGQLGHKVFDFMQYNEGKQDANGCGTNGCAIGEMPFIFPRQWIFDQDMPVLLGGENVGVDRNSCEFLGLSLGEFQHLFIPLFQRPELGRMLCDAATRYEVAANIRQFIKLGTEADNE